MVHYVVPDQVVAAIVASDEVKLPAIAKINLPARPLPARHDEAWQDAEDTRIAV